MERAKKLVGVLAQADLRKEGPGDHQFRRPRGAPEAGLQGRLPVLRAHLPGGALHPSMNDVRTPLRNKAVHSGQGTTAAVSSGRWGAPLRSRTADASSTSRLDSDRLRSADTRPLMSTPQGSGTSPFADADRWPRTRSATSCFDSSWFVATVGSLQAVDAAVGPPSATADPECFRVHRRRGRHRRRGGQGYRRDNIPKLHAEIRKRS